MNTWLYIGFADCEMKMAYLADTQNNSYLYHLAVLEISPHL